LVSYTRPNRYIPFPARMSFSSRWYRLFSSFVLFNSHFQPFRNGISVGVILGAGRFPYRINVINMLHDRICFPSSAGGEVEAELATCANRRLASVDEWPRRRSDRRAPRRRRRRAEPTAPRALAPDSTRIRKECKRKRIRGSGQCSV